MAKRGPVRGTPRTTPKTLKAALIAFEGGEVRAIPWFPITAVSLTGRSWKKGIIDEAKGSRKGGVNRGRGEVVEGMKR